MKSYGKKMWGYGDGSGSLGTVVEIPSFNTLVVQFNNMIFDFIKNVGYVTSAEKFSTRPTNIAILHEQILTPYNDVTLTFQLQNPDGVEIGHFIFMDGRYAEVSKEIIRGVKFDIPDYWK